MPRPKSKGLYFEKRTQTWYVNKQIGRRRYHLTTGERTRSGAESFLARWLASRPAQYSEQPTLTFRDAAIRFVLTSDRKNLLKDTGRLARLFPFVADKPLDSIDVAALSPFFEQLEREGRRANTKNAYISLVRMILRKCSREWKRKDGEFWLSSAPHFPLFRVCDARVPYPLSIEEWHFLRDFLPAHLQTAATFAANTGLRNAEMVNLSWSDLRRCPQTSVDYLQLGSAATKNAKTRQVPLNAVAQQILDNMETRQSKRAIFTFRGKPVTTLRNTGWISGVEKAASRYQERFGRPCPPGFRHLRFHDLRHTFATLLRNQSVNELDIAALLGHSSPLPVTALYAAPTLSRLKKSVDQIVSEQEG